MPKSKPTWEALQQRLPLLNRAELCRRADVPKSRLVDAERGRSVIRPKDLKKLWAVLDSISRQ
ncbi:MAG: hypothetical protein AAF546_00070 [Verrucomicrobiota bacterium]